ALDRLHVTRNAAAGSRLLAGRSGQRAVAGAGVDEGQGNRSPSRARDDDEGAVAADQRELHVRDVARVRPRSGTQPRTMGGFKNGSAPAALDLKSASTRRVQGCRKSSSICQQY